MRLGESGCWEDRVRRIYNNVQLRLPSAFARDEEDSEQLSEGERHGSV